MFASYFVPYIYEDKLFLPAVYLLSLLLIIKRRRIRRSRFLKTPKGVDLEIDLFIPLNTNYSLLCKLDDALIILLVYGKESSLQFSIY